MSNSLVFHQSCALGISSRKLVSHSGFFLICRYVFSSHWYHVPDKKIGSYILEGRYFGVYSGFKRGIFSCSVTGLYLHTFPMQYMSQIRASTQRAFHVVYQIFMNSQTHYQLMRLEGHYKSWSCFNPNSNDPLCKEDSQKRNE